MNKKGMTIIELVVTVALMSVILLFLYSILITISVKDSDEIYSTANHRTKLEIASTVQNDLLYTVLDDAKVTKSGDKTTITFSFNNNTESKLEITETSVEHYEIKFTSKIGVVTKWKYEHVTINLNNVHLCLQNIRDEDLIKGMRILIFVYTESYQNNQENNNLLDDIVITYVGQYNGSVDGVAVCNV